MADGLPSRSCIATTLVGDECPGVADGLPSSSCIATTLVGDECFGVADMGYMHQFKFKVIIT